jgi:hypothetical protein
MTSIVKHIAILLLAGGLAACSASAKVAVTQPKSTTIPSNSVVALEVAASGSETVDEDTAAVLQKMRSSLFGGLVADGIFKQVVQPGEPADYTMKVSVDGVRSVSQGARIFLGVLAGENKFAAHCALNDAKTGAKVADFTVTGASAVHPLSSENGMEDAISKVVEKIIISLH